MRVEQLSKIGLTALLLGVVSLVGALVWPPLALVMVAALVLNVPLLLWALWGED